MTETYLRFTLLIGLLVGAVAVVVTGAKILKAFGIDFGL